MYWILYGLLFSLVPWSYTRAVPNAQRPNKMITTKLNKTRGYWTVERMKLALANSLDLEIDDYDQTNLNRQKRDRFVYTGESMQSAIALDSEPSLEALRELGIEPDDVALFGEAEMSPKHLADVEEYPFNNYGKLFVTTPNGDTATCSAAFIRDRILFTAAHCLRDATGWFENLQFFQRFHGTDEDTYGRILEVDKPFLYSRYIDSNGKRDLKVDYAFLITAESNDVTSLGHDFSADAVSADEQVYFAGYPADTEDGTKLIWSSGTRNPQVTELFHVATNPLTSGSSGGPWLTRDSDGNYKIVGLTSHGKPTVIPGVFSPILDEETAQLLAKAESALNGESAEHTVHVEEAES